MNIEKILRQSAQALPVSLVLFLFLDFIFGNIIGGISTSLGFPITYYRCVFMPELARGVSSFFDPLMLVVDVVILFLAVFLFYNASSREKDFKKTNWSLTLTIIILNVVVLYFFYQHVVFVSQLQCS